VTSQRRFNVEHRKGAKGVLFTRWLYFLISAIHKGSLKVFGVVLVMCSLIYVTDVEMGG